MTFKNNKCNGDTTEQDSKKNLATMMFTLVSCSPDSSNGHLSAHRPASVNYILVF